jgi:hypothetical protein
LHGEKNCVPPFPLSLCLTGDKSIFLLSGTGFAIKTGSRELSNPKDPEAYMLFKVNSFGALTLLLAMLFLLLACFGGTAVYAGGGGAQWPDPSPPAPDGADDGGGDDVSTVITATILLDLIL